MFFMLRKRAITSKLYEWNYAVLNPRFTGSFETAQNLGFGFKAQL
jgi:hypothetical protein